MIVIGDQRRRAAGQKDRGRYSIIFFFTLSVTMVIFSLYGAQASVFQKARATVLDFFEPVLSLFAGPAHWVNGRVTDAQEFLRLHQELDRLRDENEVLRQYQDETRSLRQQLSYYTAVSDAKLPPAPRYIDAQVIGQSAGPFNQSLVLSAGTKDGVSLGNAVVDGNGLLGHVTLTGKGAARVLPLTDANSRIPVVLLGVDGTSETIEALLTGRADGDPVLDVFSQKLDGPLTVGQRVVTSGAGGMLPRGIPIGELSGASRSQATVSLDANIRTPNMVRVVDFAFPMEIEPESDASDG